MKASTHAFLGQYEILIILQFEATYDNPAKNNTNITTQGLWRTVYSNPHIFLIVILNSTDTRSVGVKKETGRS